MKIALIGGGGVRTMYFTQAVATYGKKLGLDHISIMDIDNEKLNVYGTLARFHATQIDPSLKVVLTQSIEEAVTDADYVVLTMRVGGDDARILDEKIALKRNLIGQETTGAGGFSYALRTIPIVKQYCQVVQEKSKKGAIIFNFTNPAGLVTQAMHSYGYTNVIGVCDGPTCLITELAEALTLSESQINTTIYGLNHLSWLSSLKVEGIEILDKLIIHEGFLNNLHESAMFDKDLIRTLKEIPNAYLYYYYHREKALHNILSSPMTRGELIKDINMRMLQELIKTDVIKNPERGLEVYHKFMDERVRTYMKIETAGSNDKHQYIDLKELGINQILEIKKEEGDKFEGYAGVAFNYIEAVKNNKKLNLPLNVANKGAIPGFADSDIVEITCEIDKDGLHPVKISEVPMNNLILMQLIKRYELLTIEAINNKSKAKAVEALMIHPLINSYSLAKELVEEYLSVFRDYVGDWT